MAYSNAPKREKKMPGRVARVKVDTIFENLKDLPIFQEDGVLKKRKDPVWTEAVRRMPEIKTHNLYLFVHQDRRNIKTNLMKYKNIKIVEPKPKKKFKKEETYNDDMWVDNDYYDSLDVDSNPDGFTDFETLITIKESDQYKNTIHKIAAVPFSVIYWYPQQISLWADIISLESTISLIAIDNVITNIKCQFESGNIYLYALTVKLDNTVILLGQMMSDSVNSLEIQYFLDSWLQGGALAPPEFVAGYSYSLLDAASLSFNFCSYDQYNLRCFRCLEDDNIGLPPTLLQIDIVSLIKVVNGWTCFDNVAQSVKDLYLCSIMYLSMVDNLEDFKECVICILALCQSPYQNDDIETRRIALWTHLTSEPIQQMNQQYIQLVAGKNGMRSFSFYNIRQNPVTSENPHDIYEFITHLKQEAFDLCNFNTNDVGESNDYYCPIILENLIQLFVEFPSWTKIFVKRKETSTIVSTCSVKHLTTLIELKDPVSPPQFLMYHCERINSLMHQGRFTINKMRNKIGNSDKEHRNNHTHLTQMTTVDQDAVLDSRIEISIPTIEEIDRNESNVIEIDGLPEQRKKASTSHQKIVSGTQNAQLDLLDLKSAVNTAVRSLLDFDKYVNNVLMPLIKPGQEREVCRTLFDCCTEMKSYEKFIGNIIEKFCTSSSIFLSCFKTIFIECYNTVEVLDKNELRNASRLFAYLLEVNAIPWDCLNVIKVNENDATMPKKNFLRILLREMAEHMGVENLENRFRDNKYKSAFKGLFPVEVKRDADYAMNFYKTIGLKALGDILKGPKKTITPQRVVVNASEGKSSENVSSADSDDSCDFIFELRVKKNGKKHSASQ